MKRRRKESGFALLLVFLMAAIIGITLYMEIPRVAFDTQRQKEQLLIERGEQYKVAIRRFLQANSNRWPASMDELESFNNRRFLRRRYKDPMTGKDEWRLVHIQNGVLTDSKNSKKTDQAKASAPNGFIQEMASLGTAPTGPQGQNIAMRRRASDNAAGGMPGSGVPDPNNPNAPPPGGVPPYPGQPQPGMPQAGQPQMGQGQMGQPGIPGQPVPGAMPPGVPGIPGAGIGGQPLQPPVPTQPAAPQSGGGFIASQPVLGSSSSSGVVNTGNPGQPVYPGQQQFPGQPQFPGAPGMPVNSQTGGVSPYPVTPGANGMPPGFAQPGMNPQQNGQAINMINNILTSPRPGGLAGLNGGNVGATGVTMGGGIAGVASNEDAESIMTYADHTNYSEWEFIFDPTKWHAPPNPNQGTIGTSAASLGTSPQNMNGPNGGQIGTPIGGSQPGGMPGQMGPGQQRAPGQQQGTSGFGSSSAFGGGGLPDIRPGRR